MAFCPGPDPAFPYLTEHEYFLFPPPAKAYGNIVAIGGNLSPGMLLSAYKQGVFPWYSEDDPLLWQSPDPRFLVFPENLHISTSMKKLLRKKTFTILFDHDVISVIEKCAAMYRPGQAGTWITSDMIDAYTELYRLGWVHSAESYVDGELVGGCYGLRIGNVFFGESMFSKVTNASKAAFLTLAPFLFADDVAFIDCQAYTDHLASLGAVEISRTVFLKMLHKTLASRRSDADDRRGKWSAPVPA